MKVLFISRATLFTNKGGDTIQVINTANHLIDTGVTVDIKLCSEEITYDRYELIHFFNIIRPSDILTHVDKSKLPFVISTIYVNYSEYEKKIRKGIVGLTFKIFSQDFIEYCKVIARAVVNKERIISPSYVFMGHKAAIKKIIRRSALLLPNSENEYKRLAHRFHIHHRYKVVPNAIDPKLFSAKNDETRNQNIVLCVGRIEGIKNQLNLVKALSNTSFKLILIGAAASNQGSYYRECRRAAGKNVQFIEHIPQKDLLAYYLQAKVHVLPSWFETTGLSSLEAAAMGCNIVITDKGDTREYFEEMAYYCDPSSPESIKSVVMLAASNPFNEALREKILREYIWPVTAAKTLKAYNLALQ
jgi:glycosyltransferase involved in cell wall biosynthesis